MSPEGSFQWCYGYDPFPCGPEEYAEVGQAAIGCEAGEGLLGSLGAMKGDILTHPSRPKEALYLASD